MKNISLAATAMLCTALFVSVHADQSGTFKTIMLDGSLADWSNPGDILYSDTEIGDGTPGNTSYEGVYLANDAENLYIAFDTKGTGGGDIINTWTRNIYIDTDMNAVTGFNGGWMLHGYDRLIQYGAGATSYSVHSFSGTSQADWSWMWYGSIGYSYSNDIAELSIPLSSLGISGKAIVVVLNTTGKGVTSEAWASEFEPDAEIYTVAAPQPATLKTEKQKEQ